MATLMLFLVSISASYCIIGSHELTSLMVDPRKRLNRPSLLCDYPIVANIAGVSTLLITVLVPLIGWVVAGFPGLIGLPVTSVFLTLPSVKYFTAYRGSALSQFVSNPFVQLLIGGIMFIICAIAVLIFGVGARQV